MSARISRRLKPREHVTVDGYSYLQDNPAPKPTPTVVRRAEDGSGASAACRWSLGSLSWSVGFALMKLILDIQRIAPPRQTVAAQASPTATRYRCRQSSRHARCRSSQRDTVERSGSRDDTRAYTVADGRELDTCSDAVGDGD